MSVYIDTGCSWYIQKKRCYITADSLKELHAFADKMKINRADFYDTVPNSHLDDTPAYNIDPAGRASAISLGAIGLNAEQFCAIRIHLGYFKAVMNCGEVGAYTDEWLAKQLESIEKLKGDPS